MVSTAWPRSESSFRVGLQTDAPLEVRAEELFGHLPPSVTEDRLESADPATVTSRFGLPAQVVVKPGEKIVGGQQFRIDRDRRLQ